MEALGVGRRAARKPEAGEVGRRATGKSAATVDRSFWSGRRVLVTGHTGFKGGWLALWLQAMGAEVVGLSDRVPTEPSFFEAAGVGDAMLPSELADVRERAAVERIVAAAGPEVVFHLAAQPLVRLSYREPVETYATNVMGTVHVLEAARRTPSVHVVVVVTSDKCYANREWEWGYREYEPMGGHDPYSNSKGCAELVTAAYRSSFFSGDPAAATAAVGSARAGNVIGGGDWAEDRLVPDLVRGALAGDAVAVRNPGAIRPWQHVLNPLSGYLVLAQALWSSREHADGWNFGPEEADARPVGWLADRLCELWGPGMSWEDRADPAAPHEAGYLKLDSSKARMALGWRPGWGIEEGLEGVVEWYRAFEHAEAMRAVSVEQIEAFERCSSAIGPGRRPEEVRPR